MSLPELASIKHPNGGLNIFIRFNQPVVLEGLVPWFSKRRLFRHAANEHISFKQAVAGICLNYGECELDVYLKALDLIASHLHR